MPLWVRSVGIVAQAPWGKAPHTFREWRLAVGMADREWYKLSESQQRLVASHLTKKLSQLGYVGGRQGDKLVYFSRAADSLHVRDVLG